MILYDNKTWYELRVFLIICMQKKQTIFYCAVCIHSIISAGVLLLRNFVLLLCVMVFFCAEITVFLVSTSNI